MAKVVSIGKLTVGQIADAKDACASKVHATYVEIGHLLRKLEDFKRKNGICTCGLSCLKIATGKSDSRGGKGRTLWCKDHDPKKARNKEDVDKKIHPFTTPYGLFRLAERLKETKEKQKRAKVRKVKTRMVA